MMKNAFYVTLKAHLVLQMFKFLSEFFGNVRIRLDKKVKVNFKIYDVIYWETNDCCTHIAQYLQT